MRKVEAFMVTFKDAEGFEYPEITLLIGEMDQDHFTVTGFENPTEVYEFANFMAKALGISEEYVFGDIWEVDSNRQTGKPILTRIK